VGARSFSLEIERSRSEYRYLRGTAVRICPPTWSRCRAPSEPFLGHAIVVGYVEPPGIGYKYPGPQRRNDEFTIGNGGRGRVPGGPARSHPLRPVPGQRAAGAGRALRVAPKLADPPRRPIEFARKLWVHASSRPYRFFRGVAIGDSKTPEHAHQVDVRLDVDLPFLSPEAAEVVPEYPRGHRGDPSPEPVDLL